MDRKQAKFILESCQPGMVDMSDRQVAEALALVAVDHELAAWLAEARAWDGNFSDALQSIHLPEGLRESILLGLAAHRGDFPEPADDQDAAMMGALSGIRTPEELRGRILAAMERTEEPAVVKVVFWKKIALPVAAAAGIAMALVWDIGSKEVPAVAGGSPLPVDVVQASFIRTYESPVFQLDYRNKEHKTLLKSLKAKGLPCPSCLPPGLKGCEGIGCRELIINGKRGSIVCFDEDNNGTVHLVIFRREDVAGNLPGRDKPEFSKHGPWVTARWEHNGHAFLLLGATDQSRLAKLF
jgi:hypothetical protein